MWQDKANHLSPLLEKNLLPKQDKVIKVICNQNRLELLSSLGFMCTFIWLSSSTWCWKSDKNGGCQWQKTWEQMFENGATLFEEMKSRSNWRMHLVILFGWFSNAENIVMRVEAEEQHLGGRRTLNLGEPIADLLTEITKKTRKGLSCHCREQSVYIKVKYIFTHIAYRISEWPSFFQFSLVIPVTVVGLYLINFHLTL